VPQSMRYTLWLSTDLTHMSLGLGLKTPESKTRNQGLCERSSPKLHVWSTSPQEEHAKQIHSCGTAESTRSWFVQSGADSTVADEQETLLIPAALNESTAVTRVPCKSYSYSNTSCYACAFVC